MSEKAMGQEAELVGAELVGGDSPKAEPRAEKIKSIRRRFVLWIPVFGAVVAAFTAVAFSFWQHRLEASLSASLLANLWYILAAVGLALLLGLFTARWLAGPIVAALDSLIQGTGRWVAGDLGQRFDLASGDELEVLSTSLNQLSEDLAKSKVSADDLEEYNRDLLDLNEELQVLDRTKTRMLANVSYELHEPLTAIGGYAEAIKEGRLGQLNAAQHQSLQVLEANLQRLMSTVDQLQTFSRVESRRLTVHLRPFQLQPVASRVIESLRTIYGSSLNLQFACSPDLPQVIGDPDRIAQVLDNLLTNAVKFSPEGGYIEVAVTEVDEGVAVQVTDQGAGIPEEEQEKVFHRFYQLAADAESVTVGIGLGLAIVREILEHHNTEVYLDSRPGMGSTFGFVLPVLTDRSSRDAAALATLVLIDCDLGFVQDTVGYLNRRGFAVQTATSVQQGLRLVRRVQPDVVLLDRMLDDGDGFEFISKQKKDETIRDIPVVIVSALQERSLGLGFGAAEYLVKPVSPTEIEETVLRVLGEQSPG
jgi:signal transduction histidine kinase/CheY-like chemotaxis protein